MHKYNSNIKYWLYNFYLNACNLIYNCLQTFSICMVKLKAFNLIANEENDEISSNQIWSRTTKTK